MTAETPKRGGVHVIDPLTDQLVPADVPASAEAVTQAPADETESDDEGGL